VLLTYKHTATGQDVTQCVYTQTTACSLGGHRSWFTCHYCAKRVAVLYSHGEQFGCRRCCGLRYASQTEGARQRAARQASKIRRRLGWTAGALETPGEKPKGMHWKTFWRVSAELDAFTLGSI